MTLGQLRDQIRFEAKIPGIETMDGFIESVIQEEARSITALIKYDELFVSDEELTLTAALATIALPTDLQHLDASNVRFVQDNDTLHQTTLRVRRNFRIENDGSPYYFTRTGTSLNLFPYSDITATDKIRINYWRYPVTLSTLELDDDIGPEVILPELKARSIARLLTFSDPKQIGIYKQFALEKRSASIGQTNLGSQNG